MREVEVKSGLKPEWEICSRCTGGGRIHLGTAESGDWVECRNCNGTGKVRTTRNEG